MEFRSLSHLFSRDIDKKRKFSVISLLRALGYHTDKEIAAAFHGKDLAKAYIMNLVEKDSIKTADEAYIDVYKKLRDGDLATTDNAKSYILSLFSKERYDLSIEALKKVDLDSRSHHKSNELSGGQIQRVAIARALVNNPSILLADEPTGNLDSKTSAEVMKIFGKIREAGNTVVLVTHEEDIAAYAKRVVRLRDGVIESDTLNP